MSKTCTVEGTHVQPCDALKDATDLGGVPRGKTRGLFVTKRFNTETGKPARTMYGAKTDKFPTGLIFNHCPWCGADLTASHPKD